MIWLIVIFLVVALTAHAPELVGWGILDTDAFARVKADA